ncbi:MAG TPA: 4-(cytidine 5'-diphospho)-2-C-methyl-D-erythritol kinase [Bryobacteraceae bacterium]|nr:4-(cytidine 5'-diphospho)-2-C-methyl-D-erythritol kinase [Bryobacteraceae bacterium]
MSARVRLRSLAKINLDLRVLGKRTDGFHELRTIFQTISLADTIEIEYEHGRTRIELHSNLDIPGNLILKATDLVMKAARATGRLRFTLTKRIPLGGGLGGGSSNAAAILLALPSLLGRPVPFEKLLELAAELGSDVPFFLTGGTALGIGRGAEVYPLPDVTSSPGLLVAPGIHSSTAAAYQALARQPLSEVNTSTINNFQWVAGGCGVPGAKFRNDFETVVFQSHPQLESIKGKLLKLGAWRAMMTGSGSSLFGMFLDREVRDRAAKWFRKEFNYQVFPFATVTRVRYRALWWRQLGISPESRLWPPQDRYAR